MSVCHVWDKCMRLRIAKDLVSYWQQQSIDIINNYCIGDYILLVWDYNKMCYVRSFDMADGRQQCHSHQLYGKDKDHLYTPYSAKFYQWVYFRYGNQNFIPDIDESRTHDEFNITFGAQWWSQLSCVVIGMKQKGYR